MTGEIGIFNALSDLLACIGIVATFSFAIWVLYRIYRVVFTAVDSEQDKETKYNFVEELAIGQTAKNKGINLNKEILKKKMAMEGVDTPTFKQKLKQEVREDFFGKEPEEELEEK